MTQAKSSGLTQGAIQAPPKRQQLHTHRGGRGPMGRGRRTRGPPLTERRAQHAPLAKRVTELSGGSAEAKPKPPGSQPHHPGLPAAGHRPRGRGGGRGTSQSCQAPRKWGVRGAQLKSGRGETRSGGSPAREKRKRRAGSRRTERYSGQDGRDGARRLASRPSVRGPQGAGGAKRRDASTPADLTPGPTSTK